MNLQVTYRPRHPDELSWGCAVTAFGHGVIPPGTPYPPEGHPPDHAFTWETGRTLAAFQLIYLSGGNGEFESEASAHESIGAGSVLLLFPGVRHRYRPDPDSGWEEWWVEFSGPVPDALRKEGFLNPAHPHYRVGDQPEIRRLLLELIRPSGPSSADGPGQRPTLTLRLLSQLQTLGGNAGEDHERETARMHESVLYLRQHHHQAIDLPQFAKDMGMSYSVWRRKFKEQMGTSPRQFILDCRIQSACNLLRNSSRRINEISERCGFASPQHFTRLFHKRTGTSPSMFRKT